jgi:hypothetical protein
MLIRQLSSLLPPVTLLPRICFAFFFFFFFCYARLLALSPASAAASMFTRRSLAAFAAALMLPDFQRQARFRCRRCAAMPAPPPHAASLRRDARVLLFAQRHAPSMKRLICCHAERCRHGVVADVAAAGCRH